MKIVIVGAGEVGVMIARNLCKDGHDIIVIEQDPNRVTKVDNELDVMAIQGDGSRPGVLEKADISPAGTDVDLLIACTPYDEVNFLSCQIARTMGVKRVISRAVALEFTDGDSWREKLGIDVMISPERSVARKLVSILETEGAIFTTEIDERAGIYAFRAEKGSPATMHNIAELRMSSPDLVTLIVYVQRGDEGFRPQASDVLRPGDICYSFCYVNQIQEISQLYQISKRRKLKRVIIVGAGKVGFQTASLLLKRRRGIDVRIIDIDKPKCVKVSKELANAIVIWGDAADDPILLEAGISSADGFVAATASEETNLMLAILAKMHGAAKTVAVIKRDSYARISSHLPIDSIVNRNDALASVIVSEARHQGNASTLMIFDQIGAESVRVAIPEGSPVIGIELKDLALPEGTLIGLVRRQNKNNMPMIPTGTFSFEANDVATIFAAQDDLKAVFEKLGVQVD